MWENNTFFSIIDNLYSFQLKFVILLDKYTIKIISDTRDFINELEETPKQDFNKLFGYQCDATTQTIISGISLEGKYITQIG